MFESLCCQRALADIRIAALRMPNLPRPHPFQIFSEVGNRRLLDVLKRKAIHRFNSRGDQAVARATPDPGDKDRHAIVDGANHRFQAVFLRVPALAVEIDSAVAHKLGARGTDLVHLKFFRVAEVLVDAPATLGRNGNQD